MEAVGTTAMSLNLVDAVMRDFKDGTRVLKCIILLSCQDIFSFKVAWIFCQFVCWRSCLQYQFQSEL